MDGIVIEWTMAMRCDKKQTDEFSLVSAVYIPYIIRGKVFVQERAVVVGPRQ